MGEFRMPSLGADMDVGTIIEWLVQPGDPVTRGQIVAVVDTAKAAIEIESFTDGVLQEILVRPGVAVPVGTPLALIGAAGEASGGPEPGGPSGAASQPLVARPRSGPPAGPRATPPVRHLAQQLGVVLDDVEGSGPGGHVTHEDVVRAAERGAAPPVPAPTPTAGPATPAGAERTPAPGRLRVTPRARRLAIELGVDLATVAGSGAHGAVLAGDVEDAAARAAGGPRVPATGEPHPATGPPLPPPPTDKKAAMRSAIANLMARSAREIPHYHVTQTMDLGPALTWLRSRNAELPARRRLVPAVLFLRATTIAAQAVPDLNGHWVDGALQRAARVDLGVAIALRGGGLVTPAIADAGALGVDELMAGLVDLVSRARRGSLRQVEMAGATITVSALGETGPDALYGVIFPPQVALVGVGGIVERPWAIDGMLTVRPTTSIVLAADHRASDGRTASAFLAAFAHALEQPEEL